MTTQVADPAPFKFTPEAFETMLTRASENGARKGIEAMKPAETKPAPKVETALQEQDVPAEQPGMVGGAVDSLDNIGGLGIPFGSVLIGAIPGVVVGELIDGFIPLSRGWMNPAAKVGAAYLGVQYGSKFLGRTGAMFFAGALALQALSNVLPIDQWAAQITGMVRRTSVVQQAESVARQAQMRQDIGPSQYREVV